MKLKIKDAARAAGFKSMWAVAEQVGVDHQTVMYWNQGRTYPRFPTLLKLLAVLDCKLEDLL